MWLCVFGCDRVFVGLTRRGSRMLLANAHAEFLFVCAGVSVLRVLPAWVRGRWSFVCSWCKAQPAHLFWSADSLQLALTQYVFCCVDYSIPSHVVVTQCCAGWRADVINVRWLSLLCGMHYRNGWGVKGLGVMPATGKVKPSNTMGSRSVIFSKVACLWPWACSCTDGAWSAIVTGAMCVMVIPRRP